MTGSFKTTREVWSGDYGTLTAVDLNANIFVYVGMDLVGLLPAAASEYVEISGEASILGQVAEGRLTGSVLALGAQGQELIAGVRSCVQPEDKTYDPSS